MAYFPLNSIQQAKILHSVELHFTSFKLKRQKSYYLHLTDDAVNLREPFTKYFNAFPSFLFSKIELRLIKQSTSREVFYVYLAPVAPTNNFPIFYFLGVCLNSIVNMNFLLLIWNICSAAMSHFLHLLRLEVRILFPVKYFILKQGRYLGKLERKVNSMYSWLPYRTSHKQCHRILDQLAKIDGYRIFFQFGLWQKPKYVKSLGTRNILRYWKILSNNCQFKRHVLLPEHLFQWIIVSSRTW